MPETKGSILGTCRSRSTTQKPNSSKPTQKRCGGFFKCLGKVRDVYISSKKSFRGRCFGFIRFQSVEEATKVAKRVNGLVVFGRKMSAKVAFYGWNRRRSLVSSYQSGLGASFLLKAENKYKDDRSFVEVVSNSRQPMQ
ncbi:hypothetical protein Dsin_013214 [Dipteronia sinensis]|uniref:RRM domain-containing protein n=1 Tax=Dipteronia sinensis TaxID=43782 RepID=A0AAE0AKT5_9ROSI|nr:hypothetical protein Dsin_013214 [Dipteronia sinensis]